MMDVILNADTDEGSEAYKTTTINTMGRKNILARGRVEVVDGTSASYRYDVSLTWTNTDQDQLNNSRKEFSGKLKVENVRCNYENELYHSSSNSILINTDYDKQILSYAENEGLIQDDRIVDEIYFVDTNIHPIPSGVTTIDYSESQNGSVLGWIENGNKLYIGGNGGVKANESLAAAFDSFNGTYINLDYLDTSNTEDMSRMFWYGR